MQGGKPPRPPVVSKKHKPCTDCTPMLTEQLLEHLQQLPWYNGQASSPPRSLARCLACAERGCAPARPPEPERGSAVQVA